MGVGGCRETCGHGDAGAGSEPLARQLQARPRSLPQGRMSDASCSNLTRHTATRKSIHNTGTNSCCEG